MEIASINGNEYELIPLYRNQLGEYKRKKLIPNFRKPFNQLVYKHNLNKWRYCNLTTILDYFCLTMAEARFASTEHWGAYYV